jgi:epoxyqueuosine reductase QueG
MSKNKRPVYGNIFEYLYENYEFKAPDTPITGFFKKDIYENQYLHLDGPVSSEKVNFKNTDEDVKLIIDIAKSAGADLIGFTAVHEHFIFDNVELNPNQKFAVVLAVEMDYDRINTAPEPPSGIEVLRGYWRLGRIAVTVAEFIRYLGYPATAHHPRSFRGQPPTILHTLAAIDAGMGEAGRHGLLITPEFGPRVRVATVTTELELPQNNKVQFGVDEFCKSCTLCMDACEGDAIPAEKKDRNGVLKYTIDPYKCLPYFAEYDGCNLCVSKCAFNKRPTELENFIKKINRIV